MTGAATDRLLRHFLRGRTISALDCWYKLGIINIVQVLNPLRGRGLEFSSRNKTVVNEWGERLKFKEYYMTPQQIKKLEDMQP